jgi:hypothetical protein
MTTSCTLPASFRLQHNSQQPVVNSRMTDRCMTPASHDRCSSPRQAEQLGSRFSNATWACLHAAEVPGPMGDTSLLACWRRGSGVVMWISLVVSLLAQSRSDGHRRKRREGLGSCCDESDRHARIRDDFGPGELGDTQCFTALYFPWVHPDVGQRLSNALLHSSMCVHEDEVDVDVDMVDGGGRVQCSACSRRLLETLRI